MYIIHPFKDEENQKMSHTKPLGYWKCKACQTVWSGEDLYQDPQATVATWTCGDLFCGGVCRNMLPKEIVAKLNA